MEQIIEGLGFTKKLIMEKYREKWQLPNVEVVIDELPFGNYLEIEGEEKDIKLTVGKLGLNLSEGIVDSYWEIWHQSAGAGRTLGLKAKRIGVEAERGPPKGQGASSGRPGVFARTLR